MANLTATILIRVSQDGNRSWVPARGKNDPAGPYYVRWCEGSRPRFVRAGKTYEEAEVVQLRLQRRLHNLSLNRFAPEEELRASSTGQRVTDVIASYLTDLAKPDANGEIRSQKSRNATKSELENFAQLCGKTYVEEITRTILVEFRDHLNGEGYQPDTVYNKLMEVVSWLKHNGVVPYKQLLHKNDWPDKKDTNPDPYSDEEIEAMLAIANEDEALLVRFFVGTGMREGEVSVAEREDIDAAERCVYVRRGKPQFGWRAKNKAAKRAIYIGDGLLADLLKRGPGLLFLKNGHRDTHLLRVIERLANAAGVTPTTAKKTTHPDAVKNDWCHRFRDTWLTNQVENAADVNALRLVCQQAGHSDLETLDRYAQQRKANDPRTRAAANASDRFGADVTKQKPKVVGIRRTA